MPIHALVVEDDEDIREMLALVLELDGCRVSRAADGREAMDVLARDDLPSVVVLDLMMPNLSGCDVLALMRGDRRLAHVPVLVLSGDGNARKKAVRCGADECLLKPVEAEELLASVHRLATPRESAHPF